jgi:hypothetical protein
MNNGLALVEMLLNMIKGRNTKIANGGLVFTTSLGKGVKLEESPSFNQSIMEYDSNGKQAQQSLAFVDELMRRVMNVKKKDFAVKARNIVSGSAKGTGSV